MFQICLSLGLAHLLLIATRGHCWAPRPVLVRLESIHVLGLSGSGPVVSRGGLSTVDLDKFTKAVPLLEGSPGKEVEDLDNFGALEVGVRVFLGLLHSLEALEELLAVDIPVLVGVADLEDGLDSLR